MPKYLSMDRIHPKVEGLIAEGGSKRIEAAETGFGQRRRITGGVLFRFW